MIAFLQEARRRGVFKLAALYVVSAWLIMQIADVFLPAWEIPETALRSLLRGAILGFPIALVLDVRCLDAGHPAHAAHRSRHAAAAAF